MTRVASLRAVERAGAAARRPARALRLGLVLASGLAASAAHAAPLQRGADRFGEIRGELAARAASPWAAQRCTTTETSLDRRHYADLNGIGGWKILDRPDGWSVEARIGGRPFHCFERLAVDGTVVTPSAPDFTVTSAEIAGQIEEHFATGKGINRLWFVHPTAHGEFPVTVVLTADGFLVVGGAAPPKLFGTTLRTGVIGEPFGAWDYAQQLVGLDLESVDADRVIATYLVESEAAVAVVEMTVRWVRERDEPELAYRTAMLARSSGRLGFVGGNALRGPTLHGLLDVCGDPPSQGGIEAYHDVRTALVDAGEGAVLRELLVPPTSPHAVHRARLSDALPRGGRVILDQTQHDPPPYFSRHPGVAYRERTDLVITLDDFSVGAVSVERAQIAPDLDSANPEANETVNVYLAAQIDRAEIAEFHFRVQVAAEDFAGTTPLANEGIVAIASDAEQGARLVFVPLAADGSAADPQPLTGPLVTSPRRPSVSSDGRWVAFDATLRGSSGRRGIYLLDRLTADVRRLTVDPGSATSFDRAASLDCSGRHFAYVSNRRGSETSAGVAEVVTGQGCGFGRTLGCADHVAFTPDGHALARTCDGAVVLDAIDGSLIQVLSAHAGARSPEFSPDGRMLAFASDSGVWVHGLDSGRERRIAEWGDSPTWDDAEHLIVHRETDGEIDLHRIDVLTGASQRLTPRDGVNVSEPSRAPAARSR